MLAAEIVICKKLLDLTWVHAVRILMRHDGKSDLKVVTREVTAELANDDRFTSSK